MKAILFAKGVATLLLVATLIMTFIISPILANSDFVDGSEEHLATQNTDKDVSSDPTDLGTATFGSTDLKYPRSETLTSAKVEPNSTVRHKSNLNNTNEWNEFIGYDRGSAQLVIGINNGRLDAHTQLMAIIAKHDCEVINTVSILEETVAVVVNVSSKEMPSFVEETRTDGLSRYIEPRMKVQAQLVPIDPHWSLQWGPQKIEADWAWNTTIGDPSVLVAVIDTGVDWDHPDLAANYVALGYDWVNNDPDPMDDEGHGTHCAGIIAAVINNSMGVAGLAQVSIMAEKGLDQYGDGYEDDLANAIIHAVDQGADILSNSWGGYGEMELIHDAVKYAYDSGVLVVAAAGNDATSNRLYPAAFDEVIAVSATDEHDNPASWTNFGEWMELTAPGVNIYSTIWNDFYDYKSGTSMSTPHVAGVAALVWSQFPSMSRDWVRLWLRSTVDDLGASGFDIYYGYGRINAGRAVEQAVPEHDLLILSLENPPYVEPGDTAYINTTVFNFGTSNESDVTVQLLANGSMVDSAVIGCLAIGTSTTVSCSWSPMVIGIYNVTPHVVPVPGEDITANNVKSVSVLVQVPPEILVVNDDDGSFWISGTSLQEFELALTAAGYDYWVWNESSMGNPPLDFLTKFQLVVWTCGDYWNWAVDPTDAVTLDSYLAQGGNILLEGEDIGYDHDADDFMVNVMHAIYQVDETGAPGLTVTDPTHPVTFDLATSFTWLTDPPYDDGVSPTNGGAEVIQYTGTTWTAVTVFQGASNGSVVYYAFPLYCLAESHGETLAFNSINWLLGVQYEHELAVALEAPDFLDPGDSSLLNATVYNRGLNNETDVELFLLINGTAVNNVTILELVNGAYYTIDYLWTPTVEATYNVTAYAAPAPGENVTANNFAMKIVTVCFVKYVLWDDVHDGDGDSLTGDYFSLCRLLSSSGFVVHELTTGTINSGVLTPYDILVLIDPEYDFSSSEISDIHDWVTSGGGLIIIPDAGYPPTLNTIMAPYGVQLTGRDTGSGTTTNILAYPITQDVESIYYDRAWELAVSSLSEALAWTLEYYAFLSATMGGKVVVVSDSNIMDNYRVEMADNTQLMLNMFNWIGVKHEHELSVSLEAPDFLEPSVSSTLNATIFNRGLNNETDVDLFLFINGTAVNSTTISELLTGASYTINYLWTPTVEATYNVTAYAPPVPGENVTVNNLVSRIVRVYIPVHDVVVTSVTPYPTEVIAGESVTVTVIIKNNGTETETFNVTVYYDDSEIDTQAVTNLAAGYNTTLTFGWYTFYVEEGDYTIKAVASTVAGETDTDDNTLVDGTVTVTILGTKLYISPASIVGPSPGLGESFIVEIYVENVVNLTGWCIGLHWDPNVLQCNSFTPQFGTGTFLGPETDWLGIAGTINNTAGEIYPPYGYSLVRWATPKSGNGTIAQVQFQISDYGFTWINLTRIAHAHRVLMIESLIHDVRIIVPVDVTDGIFELPLCYQLTVDSSPITGVTFTINGTPKTTPYAEWLLPDSYTLVMPETHTVEEARYYWSQWSDGVTTRSRTVTMTANITLTAYFTGPYYQLTVDSSPITGVTFTINGVPQITPYTEWLPEGSYTLIMPQTHNRYIWSRWLEDGDTNKIKTVTLPGTTWTAVYIRQRPVGGKATPINIPTNNLETPALWIWPTILLPLAATAIFVKLEKKKSRVD